MAVEVDKEFRKDLLGLNSRLNSYALNDYNIINAIKLPF